MADSTDTVGSRSQRAVLCSVCGAEFASARHLAGHRVGKHFHAVRTKRVTISTENLTEAQRAYMAAFLDGEGGVQITTSNRPDREYKLALHPMVYFTNTNEEAIRTMKYWIGVGCIT